MSTGQEGLNASVVVVCSIGGAGLGVLMLYAIWHRFNPEPSKQAVGNGFSQAQYMREVRLRYAEQLANSNGYGKRWSVVVPIVW